MVSSRKTVIFGMAGIVPINCEEGRLCFEGKKSLEHLANYDITIYASGIFEQKYVRGVLGQSVLESMPVEAIQRENELRSAIEKGRIVILSGQIAPTMSLQD